MGTITAPIWLKCLLCHAALAVAPYFTASTQEEEQQQREPLCAQQMPLSEGDVNSLEAEVAQDSNLFLQGDVSSLL